MKKENQLTQEQALRAALEYADLSSTDSKCLLSFCSDGLYQLVVYTPYLKYEFYVDALSGEVLGIDMMPLPYPKMLCFCDHEADYPPTAA